MRRTLRSFLIVLAFLAFAAPVQAQQSPARTFAPYTLAGEDAPRYYETQADLTLWPDDSKVGNVALVMLKVCDGRLCTTESYWSRWTIEPWGDHYQLCMAPWSDGSNDERSNRVYGCGQYWPANDLKPAVVSFVVHDNTYSTFQHCGAPDVECAAVFKPANDPGRTFMVREVLD